MSLFIRVEITEAAQAATSLSQVCPVGIFALSEGRIVVAAEREDECTLCALCFAAAPAGSVRIEKLYSGERLPVQPDV